MRYEPRERTLASCHLRHKNSGDGSDGGSCAALENWLSHLQDLLPHRTNCLGLLRLVAAAPRKQSKTCFPLGSGYRKQNRHVPEQAGARSSQH